MNQFELPLTITTVMGLDLSLRLLSEEDLLEVMELESSAHSHPWRRSSFEDCLKGRQRCWLAEHNSKLVGYVVVTHAGGDAELLNLAVSP
ncbi:MAG: ribosomal-protein-alanine N-acetyltransferase, partial [Moraxellaceae bacterium]